MGRPQAAAFRHHDEPNVAVSTGPRPTATPRQDVERDAPSLFECEWKHGGSDAEVFHSIAAGVPGTRMSPWAGALPQGDDDVWRVIAYLRSASTCKARSSAPTQ